MADLFSALGVAVSGLRVAQGGLSVTGHNVANVNTPGYSRQRQVVAATRPIPDPSGAIGTGVEQLSVIRVTDGFVENQLVQERSAAGSLDAQHQTLAEIERVLNEQGREGISAALADLYRGFEDLANASEPGQPTERASLLGTAGSLVTTVQRADRQLREIQRQADASLGGVVAQINDLSDRISELNGQIQVLGAQAPANDLLDQRDELVRQLAEKIEVNTFENARGHFVVLVAGGVSLVDGVRTGRLEARPDPANPFDPTFSSVFYVGGGNDFEVTADVGGGELGGLLRARDTLAAEAIRAVDVLAFNVANSVNEQHRLGFGLDGVDGRDFFAQPVAIEDAARDLALDAALASAGGEERIAAAGGSGTGLETDNENARALAQLAHTRAPTFLLGDPLPPGAPSGPASSAIELAAALVADVGQEARSLQLAQAQQRSLVEQLENRRDEVSGVSLDEEMTNLIRLEATFQANARVLGSVNQLLDELLTIL